MSPQRHRILFITPPGYGHSFPMIRFAEALQELGNEILVATCGVSLSVASGAGLAVIDVTPGVNLVDIYEEHKHSFGGPGKLFHSDQEIPKISHDREEELFLRLADLMIQGVMRAAAVFHADLIVHTPYAAAAAVASTLMNIPRVFLGIGLAHRPQLLNDRVYSRAMSKHSANQEPLPPVAWIDVSPPSLRQSPSDGWDMTYRPYNGKGRLTRELASPPNVPRIAVTLGTIVPFVNGLTSLRWIGAVARRTDAEFVIAHGTAGTVELGQLPSNVKGITWSGFDKLFDTCVGVIHHAGSGTTLTALRAGLPQILIPQGADQYYNAAVMARRGAATVRHGLLGDEEDATDYELVTRLLTDSSLKKVAIEVQREMLNMPPEIEVGRRLLECIR